MLIKFTRGQENRLLLVRQEREALDAAGGGVYRRPNLGSVLAHARKDRLEGLVGAHERPFGALDCKYVGSDRLDAGGDAAGDGRVGHRGGNRDGVRVAAPATGAPFRLALLRRELGGRQVGFLADVLEDLGVQLHGPEAVEGQSSLLEGRVPAEDAQAERAPLAREAVSGLEAVLAFGLDQEVLHDRVQEQDRELDGVRLLPFVPLGEVERGQAANEGVLGASVKGDLGIAGHQSVCQRKLARRGYLRAEHFHWLWQLLDLDDFSPTGRLSVGPRASERQAPAGQFFGHLISVIGRYSQAPTIGPKLCFGTTLVDSAAVSQGFYQELKIVNKRAMLTGELQRPTF